MTKFFEKSQYVDVSRVDADCWWIENTKEYVAEGTALCNEFIEELYTPSAENKIARYDKELKQWSDEVDDMRGKIYWDQNGTQYAIERVDGDYPEWGILLAPPKHDTKTQTVLYSNDDWKIYDILIGEHYYDENGIELTVTALNFELPENHTWTAKPQKTDTSDFVLDDGKWIEVPDFRGQTIYKKSDASQFQTVEQLGEIDSNYTLKAPPSIYHTFDNDDWTLTDENAQKQLNDVLTSSITRIDDIAAQVTQKWARFAEEYKERESAAIAYQDAGFTGDVSVYISSFASVAGKTNKEATLLILQQAQGLRALQEQLAVQRMRKYELKQPKLSIEQIQTLTNEICANIQALGDSYE